MSFLRSITLESALLRAEDKALMAGSGKIALTPFQEGLGSCSGP